MASTRGRHGLHEPRHDLHEGCSGGVAPSSVLFSALPMLFTRSLIPTMKEAPADATNASHVLLSRAGYIRKVGAGIYDFLPLGYRVLRKVEGIVRAEMDRAGALEILMPALLPGEYFKETGRWDLYGPTLFRIKDRKGGDYHLGSHARGDRHRHRPPRDPQLPRAAEEPLPGAGEVPRRAAAPRRPAALPRVRDEGRVLVRRGRGGRRWQATRRCARPTPHLRPHGPDLPHGAGRLRGHRRGRPAPSSRCSSTRVRTPSSRATSATTRRTSRWPR